MKYLRNRALLAGALLAAAIAALYVYGSTGFSLTEPDEARYAEIAREMRVRGDFVTPHLNFVKYFEKPPLVYWATAAAFRLIGTTELAARLPSVFSAVGTLALTALLAARMFGPRTAVLALAVLGISPMFAILGQTLTLDMSLTVFLTLAMAGVWFGWSRASRCWVRVAYLATALAVLVKGPVAVVLVGGTALSFLLVQGDWRALRGAADGVGLALAAAVALPWFLLMSWRNPEFAHYFVVDQHIARYLWTSEHTEPIWFFPAVLPVALFPWGLLPLFDPALLRGALDPRSWPPATRFVALWALVIVGFFSVSGSKLLTYVLPALPPLAILLARFVERTLEMGRTASLSRAAWLLLLGGPVMGLCAAVLPWRIDHWRVHALAPYLYAGGLALAATGYVTRRMLRAGRAPAAVAALAAGCFALLAVAVSGRGVANDYRPLGLAARAAMRPGDRIASYRRYVQGIPFYSGHRMIIVGGTGELKFGSEQGDQRAFFWPGDDDLRRAWRDPGRLFLVINRHELAAFDPPLDPAPIVVAAKDKKLLVVNRQ